LVNGPPKKSVIGYADGDVNKTMKRSESEAANKIESFKIAELSGDLSPFTKFVIVL
jgi:hypothetical protein